MWHEQQDQTKIADYIRSGHPGLYLVSCEEARAEAELKQVAAKLKRPLFAWSATRGLVHTADGTGGGANDPLDAVEAVGGLPEDAVVLLADFHLFLQDPNPVLVRAVKDALAVGKAKGRVLVVLGCRQVLPPELEREFVLLDFGLPGKEPLGSVLDAICKSAGLKKAASDERDRILDAATGLTCGEAENAFALAVVETRRVDPAVVAREKAATVFVVATANDVTQLPPELLRKGRWDEMFFADLPSAAEREAVWKIQIQRHGRDWSAYDTRELAKASEGFTGAEIEQSFIDALYAAFAGGREPAMPDIRQALSATVPLSKLMSEQIAGLRKWSAGRCRMATSPAEAGETGRRRGGRVGSRPWMGRLLLAPTGVRNGDRVVHKQAVQTSRGMRRKCLASRPVKIRVSTSSDDRDQQPDHAALHHPSRTYGGFRFSRVMGLRAGLRPKAADSDVHRNTVPVLSSDQASCPSCPARAASIAYPHR